MLSRNYKDKKEKGTIVSIVPVKEKENTAIITTKAFDHNGEEVDPTVQSISEDYISTKLASIQKMIDMLEAEKADLEELKADIVTACEDK
ncbi:MAG: hypothetical protein GY861_24375 [bacterium]|nr:hypothetical protein [bacterium]